MICRCLVSAPDLCSARRAAVQVFRPVGTLRCGLLCVCWLCGWEGSPCYCEYLGDQPGKRVFTFQSESRRRPRFAFAVPLLVCRPERRRGPA